MKLILDKIGFVVAATLIIGSLVALVVGIVYLVVRCWSDSWPVVAVLGYFFILLWGAWGVEHLSEEIKKGKWK